METPLQICHHAPCGVSAGLYEEHAAVAPAEPQECPQCAATVQKNFLTQQVQ